MAVFIRHVPYTIDEIALVQALEPVLHGPLFTGAHDEALDYVTPMNFHVYCIEISASEVHIPEQAS